MKLPLFASMLTVLTACSSPPVGSAGPNGDGEHIGTTREGKTKKGPTQATSGKLDAATIDRFGLSTQVCGGIARSCDGMGARVVDLGLARLEIHHCVVAPKGDADAGPVDDSFFGDGRADRVTTTTLTAAEVTKVRAALGGIEYHSTTIEAYDGPMTSLDVHSTTGNQLLSPKAACGSSSYDQIVAGMSELESVLDSLGNN